MHKIISKRTLVASLLGLTAFGAVFGSAASLGGLDASSLGANADVVAPCDTDGVDVSYTHDYDPTAPAGYKVTAVTVSDVADGCDGLTVEVALTGSADTSVASGSLSIPTSTATSHSVSVSPSALAESVTGAHVVIS